MGLQRIPCKIASMGFPVGHSHHIPNPTKRAPIHVIEVTVVMRRTALPVWAERRPPSLEKPFGDGPSSKGLQLPFEIDDFIP
jgi:hypothetical protein